jgi:hypothetical protein
MTTCEAIAGHSQWRLKMQAPWLMLHLLPQLLLQLLLVVAAAPLSPTTSHLLAPSRVE